MAYPDILRQRLDAAITYVLENKEKYIRNPGVDFTRDRKLTMQDTIALLLSMSGGSLKKELHECATFSGVDVSASALIQQRHKILPKAFEEMFHQFNKRCHDRKTFHKYHAYTIDGSCINMAKTPGAPSYVCNEGHPAGLNQMHLNALWDIENSTYLDAFIQEQPRADEVGAAIAMLKRNEWHGKNLIIFDRGYEAYNLFANCIHSGVDFICRVKQDNGCMKPVKGLPMQEFDKTVSLTITTTQTNEDKGKGYIYIRTASKKTSHKNLKTKPSRWDFGSPYRMENLRFVRFQLPTGQYETLCTSLSSKLSIEDLKILYGKRWSIETSFRTLKYSIGLVNLHGKSDAFVIQEIYAALTAYNFASRVFRCCYRGAEVRQRVRIQSKFYYGSFPLPELSARPAERWRAAGTGNQPICRTHKARPRRQA